MILVDTSIWIDHLRAGDNRLADLLANTLVLMHPIVIGELACGNLNNRAEILKLLKWLPKATAPSDSEVLYFIEQRQLMGRGIGYVDAHLLASVSLTQPARLWTGDKRLNDVAAELNLGWHPPGK